jgi:tetratricopeptide (TPR) repeat protein
MVETSNPECASSTAQWRQQKGWVDLVNAAIQLNNDGKTDSAVIVAKRSLQLSRSMPYGYMVLAQAAAKNNQSKEAITYYKQSIAAATDTSANIVDTRRGLQMALGAYAADLAEAATGDDKAVFMSESKAAYAALAKDPGTKYADAARNGQARLATLSGDTAAIKSSYADQLANPGAFSYNSLMQAAVTAAKANQTKDAIKLFEAARAVNPYHRDVLYNLARLYLLDSAYQKGIPVARQLVSVDPSNPDNYSLIAIAYASMQKKYQTTQKMYDSTAKALGKRANAPGVKATAMKAIIDSAAKMNAFITAYGDSTKSAVDSALKYNDVQMKMPARVSFTEFTPSETKTTIGGSVSNQTDEPKSFTLKIEFVDKSGSVVTTQEVPVGPVGPHKSTAFTATGTGAGIVAFRYAPIS